MMEGQPTTASVALGSRILGMLGVLDAFGHVSARDPADDARLLMSQSMAPALVRPSDIVSIDLDGRSRDAGDRLFLERFIHTEIYRARPDVGAIVHSHAPAVIPFSVVADVELRPICHICGFLAGTPRAFDLADHGGDGTDLLVSSPQLGGALAGQLGGASAVLMRGHGFTVTGRDIAEAVFRAVYTVRNCEIQSAAMALGVPRYLSSREAEACERTTAGQADRAWDLWTHEARCVFPEIGSATWLANQSPREA